jgi:hypothetical protein
MSYIIRADGNNPLGGYGMGELVTVEKFDTRESAEAYIIDGWGECALQQVWIVEEEQQDWPQCPCCREPLEPDCAYSVCPYCYSRIR